MKKRQNAFLMLFLFRFTEDQIAFISSKGNKAVAEKFEKYFPKYYHRPSPDDPPLIRGKYLLEKSGKWFPISVGLVPDSQSRVELIWTFQERRRHCMFYRINAFTLFF